MGITPDFLWDRKLSERFHRQQLLHDLDLVGGKFCLVHGKHS